MTCYACGKEIDKKPGWRTVMVLSVEKPKRTDLCRDCREAEKLEVKFKPRYMRPTKEKTWRIGAADWTLADADVLMDIGLKIGVDK